VFLAERLVRERSRGRSSADRQTEGDSRPTRAKDISTGSGGLRHLQFRVAVIQLLQFWTWVMHFCASCTLFVAWQHSVFAGLSNGAPEICGCGPRGFRTEFGQAVMIGLNLPCTEEEITMSFR